QVRLGRFNHQVEMIWHEAIGMNLPARLAARLAQSLDKPLAVDVVAADSFAPVPTIHDVVHGPWVLNPKFARHTVYRWRSTSSQKIASRRSQRFMTWHTAAAA